MATRAENITTAIDAIYAEIAAGPLKPSYSIDGQTVDWPAYRESLLRQAKELEARSQAADPFEYETLGY